MSRRRVVVTGIGAITPLGNDMAGTWDGIVNGRSGIGKITHFDASRFPSQIAGEVKNFDFTPWLKKDPDLKTAMSNTKFALAACEEAIRDSGLELGKENPRRVGLYFAAGDSGAKINHLAKVFKQSFNGSTEFQISRYLKQAVRESNTLYDGEQEPYMTLRHLIQAFEIEGPVFNCLTACAASAQAIGEGTELIRHGEADVIVSGGSHSMIHPLGVAGFCLLTTLSQNNDSPETASRPFDQTRNGFVLSEGAGAVILEEYEHARKRGARVYGELIGYGTTADAYRLTDSHPEGVGAMGALRMAIQDAQIALGDVDYLNAHGTSTKVNDAVETLAIKKVFGEKSRDLWVSSTKSITGHLIAAAGVLELMICLLAMRDSVAPPTINYRHKDPACDLDYVPNESRQKEIKVAMSNSFGFGGQNVVLVAKKI